MNERVSIANLLRKKKYLKKPEFEVFPNKEGKDVLAQGTEATALLLLAFYYWHLFFNKIDKNLCALDLLKIHWIYA